MDLYVFLMYYDVMDLYVFVMDFMIILWLFHDDFMYFYGTCGHDSTI